MRSLRNTLHKLRTLRTYSLPFLVTQATATTLLLIALWHIFSSHLGMMLDESNPLYLTLETIELLLMLLPPLLLLYWSRNTHNREQPIKFQWLVVTWIFIGFTAVLGVILALRFHHYLLSIHINPRLVQMELITGAGVGSILGFSVGRFRAEKEHHAGQIADQRDAFMFLNRVLRHHVLNSVQLIEGYATYLENFDDPELKRIEQIFRDQSNHVTNLVSNVRMIMRTFTKEPSLEPIDLASIVTSECQNMERLSEDISIQTEIPSAVFVQSNPLLQAVIRDLLQNAVEHNDRDTTRITVTISEHTRTARLVISDNGPGIPESEKAELLHSGKTGNRGTGLYLINRIISQQDGTLQIRDNEPRGTTVEIELKKAIR